MICSTSVLLSFWIAKGSFSPPYSVRQKIRELRVSSSQVFTILVVSFSIVRGITQLFAE